MCSFYIFMKDLFLTFENYTWAKGKDEGPRGWINLGLWGWYLPYFIYFFILFMYLFLAALGLCRCAWTFSSCDEQGLLSSWGAWSSHCNGFSCCRAWPLGTVVETLRLGFPATWEMFLGQGSNSCPLHCHLDSYWTSKEVPLSSLIYTKSQWLNIITILIYEKVDTLQDIKTCPELHK